MKRLFTFLAVCLIALFSVWCTKNASVKDVSTSPRDTIVTTDEVNTDEVNTDSIPDVDITAQEQEWDFDPDSYEDKEIDDLLWLLEWLVEG